MDEFVTAPGINVNMLLCDAAQSVNGKFFILGGGLSQIGPKPQPVALALHLEVPWDQADRKIPWKIVLLDEDGQPALVGDKPVALGGSFTARRRDGLAPGSPLGVALAITIAPLPVPGGRSYVFALEIEGQTQPNWRVRFHVVAATPD